MPDRYLREALLRSDRWNACSIEARDLYVRLLMVVDDFGCYDARDGVVASAAYYMGRREALPLVELHACGLITRYTNAGKLYLAILRWGETLRGRRRYPAPPICNDLPEIKYRGKYGTKLNFANPAGSDPVSILVDVHGRPVMPQPPEWRRPGDWLPLADQSQRAVTESNSPQLQRAVTSVTSARTPAVTAHQDSTRSVVSSQESAVIDQESATQQSAATGAPSNSAQSLPTATPPGNGRIQLQGTQWRGVSEAQAARWQQMFDGIDVADQLEHAAAWLAVHHEERALIERDQGEEKFIVRWLLREARPGTGTTRAKTDA